ncbi:MAG: YihY/virulence factor BrkB family protein [Gemmatimonadota bacterium]
MTRAARGWRFIRDLIGKAYRDDIFFMAGAITFNLVIAIVPILLLAAGVTGWVLRARFVDPGAGAVGLVLRLLPRGAVDPDLVAALEDTVGGVVDRSAGLSLAGALVLVWISTRLVGTLRSVLRRVFDQRVDRSLVAGKWFDFRMVLVGASFIILGLGLARGTSQLIGLLSERAGLAPSRWVNEGAGAALELLFMWILLLVIYRVVPLGRLPRRTTLTAATITAVSLTVLKEAFAWYIRNVADFSSTYGNLATLAVLFFYLYYASVAFVLGGEASVVLNGLGPLAAERILNGEQEAAVSGEASPAGRPLVERVPQ